MKVSKEILHFNFINKYLYKYNGYYIRVFKDDTNSYTEYRFNTEMEIRDFINNLYE